MKTMTSEVVRTVVTALLVAAAMVAVALICGCDTMRTKSVEVDGLFTQASAGLVAAGVVDVTATPVGEEAVLLKMGWESPLLAPSELKPFAKLQMTGTNTCALATDVVEAIARAVGANHSVTNASAGD